MPFAIVDRVGNEIENPVKEGIFEKVETSVWASPIVPVQKSEKYSYFCEDYKGSINPYLLTGEHFAWDVLNVL